MNVTLLIDGMMSGTGVRDAVNGGYLELGELGLSDRIVRDIRDWQADYRTAHIEGHPPEKVAALDKAGLALMARLQTELPDKKIGYYSDGLLTRLA